jgi:hypothetical protein
MKQNAGTFDRIVRVIIGLALLAYAWMTWGDAGAMLAWIAGIAGAVMLFTGLSGWCALYAIFGIKTCKTDD